MTAAAIQAQLVDVRNLGTEKCIKLTLHVPAEQAMQVLECFGWATAVNPVPVALARLNSDVATSPREADDNQELTDQPPPARPVKASGGAKERRPFASLPLPQQAGMLCNDPVFWAFVREDWSYLCESELEATGAMYKRYGITSRSSLSPTTSAGKCFLRDCEQFIAWKLVAA